ncbi:MAG: 3-phenylpropionate/trans-cinnamate dioxygenase ferredoxin component, partial [Mycobacteriales bacterium]
WWEVSNRTRANRSVYRSSFDLATGKPTGLPATEPVPVYPVKTEGDDVLVAVEE